MRQILNTTKKNYTLHKREQKYDKTVNFSLEQWRLHDTEIIFKLLRGKICLTRKGYSKTSL